MGRGQYFFNRKFKKNYKKLKKLSFYREKSVFALRLGLLVAVLRRYYHQTNGQHSRFDKTIVTVLIKNTTIANTGRGDCANISRRLWLRHFIAKQLLFMGIVVLLHHVFDLLFTGDKGSYQVWIEYGSCMLL